MRCWPRPNIKCSHCIYPFKAAILPFYLQGTERAYRALLVELAEAQQRREDAEGALAALMAVSCWAIMRLNIIK